MKEEVRYDRRRWRRLEGLEEIIKVNYRIRPKGKEGLIPPVRNICGGGIRLSLLEKIAIGTFLDLDIIIPELPNVIPAKGRVIWIQEIAVSGQTSARYYETGIEFIDVDPVSLGKIYTYFSQIKENEKQSGTQDKQTD